MPDILTPLVWRATDANGDPLPGALANVYVTGTLTRATVYTDPALTIPHANPIVADAQGVFPAVFPPPDVVLKVNVTTAAGAVVPGYPIDPVSQYRTALPTAEDIGLGAITVTLGETTTSGPFTARVLRERIGTATGGAVDLSSGNLFLVTLASNTTITFTNPPPAGVGIGFTIQVTSAGAYTITWPTSVKWRQGIAPSSPFSGAVNVYTFFTHDGGTTYQGFLSGDSMA